MARTRINAPNLYDEVIAITSRYLGPAAQRFIDRQIESHLNKTPGKLSSDELVTLLDWIKAAISLLTEDRGVVDDYTSMLLQLAEPSHKGAST